MPPTFVGGLADLLSQMGTKYNRQEVAPKTIDGFYTY